MRLIGFASAILVGCFSWVSAAAQQPLAGTAWKGVLRVPQPTEVVFQFKQDTLVLYEASSRAVLETMVYTQKDGQYTCKKVRGDSPCDDTTVGNYSYRIDKDVITIAPVLDLCMARAMAFVGALKRVSWPAK